jgi:ABC-type uncharacterized transport system substrate-binding protein
MTRRDLFLLIAGAVGALPEAGRAERQRLVGFLSFTAADVFVGLDDYRRGLNETGYVEGRNLVIDYRWADSDHARLAALAADLVRENVEVISAFGGPDPAKAALAATATIPIVSNNAAPLVKRFNRPEGNLTGLELTTGDLLPKRLQILAEIAPGASIGVLMNPAFAMYDPDRRTIENAAKAVGVTLAFVNASADPDFDPAVASLARQHVGALLPDADPFLNSRREQLIALTQRYAIPAMYEWREAVLAGGLISYGPSLRWAHHQVGRYTGQILNGAKPADLPVVAPTKFELAINLKTAKALGLTIPPSLLAGADEVIE